MLPTEQARFFQVVAEQLGAYGKHPQQSDLEAWWRECRGMSIDALEAAFKVHRDDQERGERAPRPVDVTRRMRNGARDAQRCACVDTTGPCEYPGIFSDGTMGDGPWYCPWHRLDRVGPEAARWIEVSCKVPYEEALAKRRARMLGEAQRADGVVRTSHTIAKRHGNRPWRIQDAVPPREEAA